MLGKADPESLLGAANVSGQLGLIPDRFGVRTSNCRPFGGPAEISCSCICGMCVFVCFSILKDSCVHEVLLTMGRMYVRAFMCMYACVYV